MQHETARSLIKNSSWYKELTGCNFPAAKIINLARPQFEQELQAIIDRHKLQQIHIDEIKHLCHVKLVT